MTIASKKQFFHKIISFCIRLLKVPDFRTFREPSGDVPRKWHTGWASQFFNYHLKRGNK